MKKVLILCATLVWGTMLCNAQNLKFGKPSQLEWSMVAWGEAPDAEALVLCKTVEVNYEMMGDFKAYDSSTSEISLSSYANSGTNSYVSQDRINVTYKTKLRTKILKDSGAKFANIDIVYYSEEHERTHCDEIFSLNIVVFDNSTGKVKRRKINPENWTDERVDAHYKVRHVRIPDVKAGNIIEYQYDLSSKRFAFLYDWQVQEEIPVMYSKCTMNIPAFLQFNMQTPIHPFVDSKVVASNIQLPQEASDLQAPKKVLSNLYTIESHDMLPKDLDLQRKMKENSAQVEIKQEEKDLETLRARLNIQQNLAPAPMPKGKRHIMINPE